MGRQPCCDKIGLKRGPWTIEEDHKLMSFILKNGIQCWRMVPKLAGLLRCGKSCRLRWINYLRPDLKRGAFSEMEENQIIELHARLGNRWSKIASHFPGRTDNEIKNHWNTRIKKRLKLQGLDRKNSEEKIESNYTELNTLQDKQEKNNSKQRNDETFEEGPSEIIKDEIRNNNNNNNNELIDHSTNLIDNYDLICRSLDMDMWMINQETNPNMNPYTSCHSPSFSLEESLITTYPNSTSEQSALSFQEVDHMSNPSDQWTNLGSMHTWDCFGDQNILFSPTME